MIFVRFLIWRKANVSSDPLLEHEKVPLPVHGKIAPAPRSAARGRGRTRAETAGALLVLFCCLSGTRAVNAASGRTAKCLQTRFPLGPVALGTSVNPALSSPDDCSLPLGQINSRLPTFDLMASGPEGVRTSVQRARNVRPSMLQSIAAPIWHRLHTKGNQGPPPRVSRRRVREAA